MSEYMKFELEKIANEIKSYEGQLVLAFREKEITENYGREGALYFMAPIITTLIRTVETGILTKEGMLIDPEKIDRKYIESNPLIGQIPVQYKTTLQYLQYHKPQVSDIISSEGSINIFLEDLIKESRQIFGTEFNTNTTSKFYSRINNFAIICGNDDVKKFLTDNYSHIGNEILKKC